MPEMSRTLQLQKRRQAAAALPCPCGSDLRYADCCARWHDGLHTQPPCHAPTPEALMRSRYSAYVLGLVDYLLATWHPSTAPGDLELQAIKWIGLEVRHAARAGDAGVVEFIARYRDSNGRAGRLHEVSRFVREGIAAVTATGGGARWLYIDGQQPTSD